MKSKSIRNPIILAATAVPACATVFLGVRGEDIDMIYYAHYWWAILLVGAICCGIIEIFTHTKPETDITDRGSAAPTT
jgi:hypothetical protein